jgi:hypothetical protein
MAGSRTFACRRIARTDLAALTHEAGEISGITYVMDVDKREAEAILKG